MEAENEQNALRNFKPEPPLRPISRAFGFQPFPATGWIEQVNAAGPA